MPSFLFKTKVILRSLVGESVWGLVQALSTAPRHRLVRLCRHETKQVVRNGPFAGMKYIHDTMSGGYIPKVLGIYERELHPVLSSVRGLRVRRVLNIGAADGYYAVGLCLMIPDLRVVAFELEERGRQYVRAMAERNGVAARIDVQGACDVDSLREASADPCGMLVLCDVEGYEDVLMDPQRVPGLRSAWLLVEIHDCKNVGVSERIRERFQGTHNIETIWQTRRCAADFPFDNPYTRCLPQEHLAAAVNEGRPIREGATPMSWFWMVPKDQSRSSLP